MYISDGKLQVKWKAYTSSHFANSACSWLGMFLFILGSYSISKVLYRVPWKDKSKIKFIHGMTSFLGMHSSMDNDMNREEDFV
jgi:hypothetical protein